MNRILILLIAMGTVTLSPATAYAAEGDSPAPQSEPRTMGKALDDSNITATVKAKLLGNTGTQGLRINVTTRNGVVWLTGQVKSESEISLAGQLAAGTTGVKGVENKLTLLPGSAS